MNLVSYEYVTCQEANHGVLVLSEFAGAAQTLGAGCVRVNPYNIEELARGISDAIAMGEEQRVELSTYASQYVNKFTAQAWAQSFIASLEEPDSEGLREQSSYAHTLNVPTMLSAYRNATRRLILLGVGGTFLPATGATANDQTTLTGEQRGMLVRLLRDPANTVLLTSGRSRSRMDELMSSFLNDPAFERLGEDGRILLAPRADPSPLASPDAPLAGEQRRGKPALLRGKPAALLGRAAERFRRGQAGAAAASKTEPPPLPASAQRVGGNLWALAESGVFARVGSGVWETTLQAAQSDEWLESVEEVFRYFEERTPGSRVERRDRTIRWAYGAADPELGAQQASNLVEHLEKLLGDAPVERSWEGTCVEVRPHGSSCGHGLMQLFAADLAKAEAAAAAHTAAGGPPPIFVPRGFDFVLGLGNFSSRDEDVFLQLHSAEARSDWEQEHHMTGGAEADDPHDETEPSEEAPPLTLGLNATTEGMRALDVPFGGVFSVILGNRSTHARYFLPSEVEATRVLQALARAAQEVEARQQTIEQLTSHAAAAAALANATSPPAALEGDPDRRLPSALERSTLVTISKRIAKYWTPAFCLDYDGTLAPMVADPAAARLPPGTRALLREIADRHPTAIVSGRSMDKLRAWVDVAGLYFAGSHGFEIVGPHGSALNYTFAQELLPSIQGALAVLRQSLKEVSRTRPGPRSISRPLTCQDLTRTLPHPLPRLSTAQVEGVMIEDNKFALSVHTRNVSTADLPRLDALLEMALEEQPLLRRSEGKHVIELRPQVHWHKGRAVEWLLKSMCEQMGLPSGAAERNKRVVPIYIGDDRTDEVCQRARAPAARAAAHRACRSIPCAPGRIRGASHQGHGHPDSRARGGAARE